MILSDVDTHWVGGDIPLHLSIHKWRIHSLSLHTTPIQVNELHLHTLIRLGDENIWRSEVTMDCLSIKARLEGLESS